MNYLGQTIELIETEPGWVCVWHHCLVEQIEVGFFTSAQDALEVMMELIQKDLAVTCMMNLVNEWTETGLITKWEEGALMNSLTQSVLMVLDSTE